MKVIKRDIYLNKLINRKNNGLIKIITGIRRCGKSYLLFKLYYDYLLSIGVEKKNIIALSLDDDLNREYRNPDKLRDYIYERIIDDNEQYYVLLDEVQFAISKDEIHSNEPLRIYGILNGLLRKNNVDIYVTGSNSRFLSSDIMSEFRGRGDEVRIYPLSFKEFYQASDLDKYDAFDEYQRYGGLPMLLNKQTGEEKEAYLNDVLKNTYIKDVIERHELRGNNAIDDVVNVLASDIGSLTNPYKLANTFKSNGINVSDMTISLYLEYLMDAFLISRAKRFDIKGKKYINTPYKYYFTDLGIRNSKLGFAQMEPTHIMENIIYNELLIRGYNVDVGIVDHVIVKNDGKRQNVQLEVDFVCNKYSELIYIQSAFSLPDEEKMSQECASLDRINDSFKKIIITMDRTKPWRNEKGYLVLNLFDFLLDENSLKK